MKFKDSIQIELDKTILIGNKDNTYGTNNLTIDKYNNKFQLVCDWCMLKEQPNKIFCLEEYLLKEKCEKGKTDQEIMQSGLEIVNLKEIAREELKRILNNEIDDFISKNINNISYLFEKDIESNSNNTKFNKIPSFLVLYEIGFDLRNSSSYCIEEKVNVLINGIKYRNIGEGKVNFSFNQYENTYDITFDIKNMKFEESNQELLEKLYSKDTLKRFLAFEQYKKGMTPDYYNELAKINRFLQEKKSVTAVLKDGKEKKIQAEISNIVRKIDSEIMLGIDEDRDINNLKSIKYGRNELMINVSSFQNLEQQLDRLIELKEKNIVFSNEAEEKEL